MEFKYRILNFDFELPNVNLKLKVNYEIVSSVFSSQFLLCTRMKKEILLHIFSQRKGALLMRNFRNESKRCKPTADVCKRVLIYVFLLSKSNESLV